jgi:hypothetical protein
MSIEEFIKKSKLIHGDKFDYSLFEYTGSKNKSTLICNSCETEFLTTPSNNLLGKGCKNCYEISKIDKEKVLETLSEKNKNWKFNLDSYINSDSKIDYICNNNHKGESTYRNMIRYNVCKKCKDLKLLKIKKEKIENNNLSIIEYSSDLDIECKCNKCLHTINGDYRSLTYENFKCKYCILYEKSNFLKEGNIKLLDINGDKIKLMCKNGHIYFQNRRNLLSGRGCNKCRIENKVIKKEDLINLFRNIHGDLFDYKIDGYKNVHSKINITCRKGHNFEQKVSNHLQGKGCNICRESIGERNISIFLERNKIKYTRQKKFKDCKYITLLPFDFYLEDLNILIEYDGIQHFEPVSVFGGIKEFEKTKIRDKIKNEYCEKNNIHLIRISYLDDFDEKLSTINELIILQS